jgi:hypothetical protein
VHWAAGASDADLQAAWRVARGSPELGQVVQAMVDRLPQLSIDQATLDMAAWLSKRPTLAEIQEAWRKGEITGHTRALTITYTAAIWLIVVGSLLLFWLVYQVVVSLPDPPAPPTSTVCYGTASKALTSCPDGPSEGVPCKPKYSGGILIPPECQKPGVEALWCGCAGAGKYATWGCKSHSFDNAEFIKCTGPGL